MDHRGDYSGYCVAAVVVAAVAVVIDGGGIAVQLLVVKDDYSEIKYNVNSRRIIYVYKIITSLREVS